MQNTSFHAANKLNWQMKPLKLTLGLSTQDHGFGSDADQGSGSKDHFAFTWPQSGSKMRAVLRDSV